jgi:uncharacterized protein YndB with AHSA1/START domain
MTAQARLELRVTRRFSASAERVFDAWLDPDLARKFLFATPTGQVTRVEIDARPGGRYVIVDRRNGQDAAHFGEYLEIDRPRRLVFTLSVEENAKDADRIVVEIVPLQTGCELTLTHETSAPTDMKERITEGWTSVLAGLDAALQRGTETA